MKGRTKKLLCLNLSVILLLSLSAMPVSAAQTEDEALCAMESGCVEGAVDYAKPQAVSDASATLAGAASGGENVFAISVGSVRFDSSQKASGKGWTYSPIDHSLTLNGYSGNTISASGDLVIYTNGNCKITGSSGKYGGSALAASGNLDIYVQSGTLSATAGSGSVSGGDAVSVSGILYCHCDGTASFTGGATTGTQKRGGDALYSRSSVILNGSGITATGGSASTSSAYGLRGGCAIWAPEVFVYADCTLKGGTGYIGGPAVYFTSYCQFGIVKASVSGGGKGFNAILSPNGRTWYYHPHTTRAGTNDSFTISVNRYTLTLDGNGGTLPGKQSVVVFKPLPYPASHDLGTFSSGSDRDGYTQVAWGRVAGELQSASTEQETWTDAEGASHTTVWETWTESELIPYDAYYQPAKDTTLYAKWVPTGANDILLNGLFGRFSDGTAFRKTTGTAAKLPKTLSYAYAGDKNVLAWTDVSAASSNDLHIYKESAFYSGGDVIAPDAGAATVLYAWENDGLFARYHATLGQLRQGGSVLLQGEGADMIASATSLKTYVPDDSLLIAPENYEFAGWSLREDAITADYLPGDRITLRRNVTDLYAVWVPTELTGELTDGVTLTQSFRNGRITVSATAEWCGRSGAQTMLCALYDSAGRMLRSSVASATAQGITVLLPYQAGSYATCKLFLLDGSYRPIGEPLTCVPENLWHDSTGTLMGRTVILHSNDVHGNIEGYAYIAALKAEYEAQGAEVILVDAGDFSQGTTYVSTTRGADAVAMMNAAGYDIVTLGNHEFDYGYAQLRENLSKADFKVLCADVFENDEPIYDANYTYTTRNGLKLGFFGLETPEAQTKANPANIKGLTFLNGEPLFECAQDQIDALNENADIVICLAHLGVDDESTGHQSYDLWNNTTGIDMIIDGHSHTVMTEGANGEPIQSTGSGFENIGVIVIDNSTKSIERNYLIPVTEKSARDTTVAAAARGIVDRVNAEYGEVFARSEVTLNGAKSGPGNRDSETNNGDLLTDAMLWTVLKDKDSVTVADDHVVAITNGGGIRAAIHPGNVTKKDINTVLPFGNTVTVVYVTGEELLEALEASTYCTPTAVGGFPQVAGIDMTIDTTKAYDANAKPYPASTYYGPKTIARVTINSVNGKAFSLTDTYAVVTNDFCAAGGDTYYAFAAATAQFDTGIPLDEAVMDYVTNELGGVIGAQYAEPQGRITVLLPDLIAATRVWLVEQLCSFFNIDTSAYDPNDLTFTDCADLTDAQKCAILAAVDEGIVAGMSDSTFAPQYEMTREQGATLLYRAAGSPSVSGVKLPYSDVAADRFSAGAIRYLYSIGVLENADKFDPAGMMWQHEFTAWLDGMRAYYTPENLHFEVRDGVGYLVWDGPIGKRIEYFVYVRDDRDGNWFCMSGTNQTEEIICDHFGSNFGYRVETTVNGNTVATGENLALKSVANCDSTVQEVTSATFTQTKEKPLTYRADVTGVAGYPLVLLDVDTADDRNAWCLVTGGNNEVSITVYDDDDIVADGKYSVWGYSNYALSDDGNTLTYDTCTLNSPKPCAPQTPTLAYSVSNLRFITDQETGLPALAWDFGGAAADEVHFRVIGIRSDGSLYNGMGTDRPQVSLAFDAGKYTSFEVRMFSNADGSLLASATADLTLAVTQDTDDLRADMIFYDLGNDEYLVSITGMNGYNNYHAYMRDTPNSGDGFYGWVDGSGASARIYFDGNRLLANRSCEVYGMTDYVLTSSTQASYHTALVYSSATPNIQPYTITNIRFETIGGLPQLAWDAPVVAGTRFRVFTNRTGNGGYKYDVGGTGNYLSMPVTIQESGEYEGMLVQAYYRDIPLKFACDDLLCVSVNSASAAASAAVDITKENNGRYRVDASGFTGYDVYSIKFATDPNGPDWRIGSFGETEGKNVVTAYFNDDGTYCEDGYYRICATKNYALSGDNKTLTFDLAVLNDWTPCSTETPHDHVWTTATEQSWLIPAQSVCSHCGLLRVDEACLRDEALQTLTYTEEKSVQQNASGKSFYATVGTFKNAQQETVYTELRTNTFDTDDWEELFAWNGEMGTPQQRMFEAYGYEQENNGVAYRRMAVNTYDQNHHKTRVDYYRVNADGIYVPDGWDVDFVYDVNGNLLSYKFYEAHGHNAWNYENTYYPNGVRASERLLDPDNGDACVQERCFTAEGELWKFSYNFNGTVEVTYYGGYSEQNPYVYDGN